MIKSIQCFLLFLLLFSGKLLAQNVGIGTTTPANKLSVVGKMDISDSLGIGTTTPAGKLHVKSLSTGIGFIDQQQSISFYNFLFAGYSNNWQSFTAGATGLLTRVDLKVSSTLNGSSPGTIKIFMGEGNTGTLLSTTAVTFQKVLNTFQPFTLSSFPTVIAGNKYTIEFSSSTVNDGWIYFANTNPYTGGSTNLLDPSFDYLFKTYVASDTVVDALVVADGKAKVSNLQITNGAENGFILKSDATGNASWVNANTLSLTETDPKVGTLGSNKIPKWNGTALTDGLLFDDGFKVGIGTTSPSRKLTVISGSSFANASIGIGRTDVEGTLSVAGDTNEFAIGANPGDIIIRTESNTKRLILNSGQGNAALTVVDGNTGIGNTSPTQKLDVSGTTKTTALQITNGATDGFVLKSDASGNANWANVNTLISETDPKVGTLTSNKIPKWNGTTLADGLVFDNGTKLGIGTTTPLNKLSVVGTMDLSDSLGIGTSIPANELSVNGSTDISGKLGIGTNNPLGKLHIKDSGDAQLYIESLYASKWSLQSNEIDYVNGIYTTFQVIDRSQGLSRFGIDNNGNVGIGNIAPSQKLDVSGTTKTTDLQITNGATDGFVLKSDSSGNANWANVNTLISETDPKVGTLTSNRIPKWNGTTLADGSVFDNGTNVGIGTTLPSNKLSVIGNSNISGNLGIGTSSPTQKLDVSGTTKTTNLQITNGASNGFVLKSDASGNASWVNANTLIVTETDPKVGTLTSNKIPKWNGTNLADGLVFDNGTNVGIGTSTPTQKLDVIGTTRTSNLQITNGATNGFVLKSDASGNASWVNANSLTVTETDPKVGTLTNNKIPKWNGTTLADGLVFDDGTNLGIGTVTPSQKLDVSGTTKTTNLQITNGAANGYVLKSDATGNASWVNANTLSVTETDPKVGTLTSNKIPKWNGTNLADGLVFDNGTNVGIGTLTPSQKLDVNGTTKTTNLQITNGASNGFVLKSDATGNASWINANTLTVTETDPKVGTLTSNKIPKWNGTTLADGLVFDDGTNVGIGTSAPAAKLHVASTSSGLRIDVPATQTAFSIGGAGSVKVDAIGVEGGRLLINDNGNMGIGNTNPITTLDVNGGIRTKYSGSYVIDLSVGTQTVNITMPNAVPAGWDASNTMAIVIVGDGTEGFVRAAKITSPTNLQVRYQQEQNGLVRLNWVILKL